VCKEAAPALQTAEPSQILLLLLLLLLIVALFFKE